MDRRTLMHRTKRLAHECVRIASLLTQKDPLGRIITSQLIKSGTSVGANYRAACFAQSPRAFKAKLQPFPQQLPLAALGRLTIGSVLGVDAILQCFGSRADRWASALLRRHRNS